MSASLDNSLDQEFIPDIMHLSNHLELAYGQCSVAGVKEKNDDCLGVRVPQEPLLTTKGAVVAISDGVSAAIAGREAAEICIQGLLNDYYDTPEAWSVKKAVLTNFTSLNRWLYTLGQGSEDQAKGYVTTLSTLILKSNSAYVFHVGDSRVYQLRGSVLEQITRDHSACTGEYSQLTRAMGFDTNLDVDLYVRDAKKGDLFFLSTDGIHSFLAKKELEEHLNKRGDDLDECCKGIVKAALYYSSNDNLSCQIVQVNRLDEPSRDEVFREFKRLPFPPDLSVGMIIDDQLVEKVILESARSQVYLVKDQKNGRRYVLKTPSVNFEDDISYLERFVMETWIGNQIQSKHVVKIVKRKHQQQFLYNLFEYVEGPTLEQWIESHPKPSVDEVLKIIHQIILGLRAMHRKDMIHQDLKPGNIVISEKKGAVIIDFGSCLVAGLEEIYSPFEKETLLGTVHFSAPEYRLGRRPNKQSDIYSLATIAYQMFTGGEMPYGEAFEKVNDLKGFSLLSYIPSYHCNPMVPVWVDGVLRKAVSIQPGSRYERLSEMEYEFTHPNENYLLKESIPLLRNRSTVFWKWAAAILLIFELLTLYFWLIV